MKEYIEYIFLALIQGITEFLPVSSSGHIEFLKHIINNPTIQKEGAFITVILHLATALSIIVIFREKLKNLLFRHNSESKNYILKVLVSMIPVAILVLFNIDQNIEDKYNEGWGLIFIGLMFLITAMILFFTEKISIKTKNITYIAALIIGMAQAIAILPGISRSGLTICCALLLGATKKEASTFSVNSDGDIRTRAAGCRYEKVDGNLLTNVGGKIKTQVDGGNVSCINGGAFDAMISSPDSNAYKLNVSGTIDQQASGDVKINASGNVDIDGTEIYLN